MGDIYVEAYITIINYVNCGSARSNEGQSSVDISPSSKVSNDAQSQGLQLLFNNMRRIPEMQFTLTSTDVGASYNHFLVLYSVLIMKLLTEAFHPTKSKTNKKI
uniref:Uncharacterized protein n=1 Tax=Cuerna arida TaxID=1464854 RepID=A0A1B6FKQ3_9HEMI